MNKILTVVLLSICLCFAANGQTANRQFRNSKVEQELIRLEKDWSAAFLKHDLAAIERILDDDFVGIDGRGFVSNKQQEIDEAKIPDPKEPAPPFVILEESLSDFKVRVYGNTAIINCLNTAKIKAGDKISEIQYRRTTVWVKRQGNWRCVSFHGSRVLQPSK